jgi:Allene oxide cyclase barrel like domain
MSKQATTLICAGLSGLAALSAVWLTQPASAGAGSEVVAPARTASTLKLDVDFSPFFLLDFNRNGVRVVHDVRKAAPSKGDQTIFHDKLLRDGRAVGHEDGACTVTRITPTADPIKLNCVGSVVLPRGQITFQGFATAAPAKHLVVTGGTGRFARSAGRVTLTEFGDGTGSLVVHLTQPS